MAGLWYWLPRRRPTNPAEPAPSTFVRVADAVSEGMGTPGNIVFWVVLVAAWFALFALNPQLQDTNFLPAWFTSNSFNFPLNTITTLAELFIGFLIAAAANRVEKRNWELHQKMAQLLENQQVILGTIRSEVDLEEHEIAELRDLLAARRAVD